MPVPVPSQGFQSEGLGKGSTFFIDLPIYSSSVVKSSLHHDDPAFSNEPCLSDSAQLLYSLSEEVEDEDDDDNGGDRQQGAMVHPFSTLPAPAAAMPSTEVVQEAPSQVTDRLPTRILIADDSSMNRWMVDSSHVHCCLTADSTYMDSPKQEDYSPHAGELYERSSYGRSDSGGGGRRQHGHTGAAGRY